MVQNLSLVPIASILLPFVSGASAFVPGVDSVLSNIFKRQCSQCPAEVKTTCPDCPKGSVCSLAIDACGCTKPMCMNPSGQLQEPPKKPNAGAIGGGVAAAFVIIAIIAAFVWRSVKRRRKLRAEAEEKAEKFANSRSARHSQASISTTTTRASNVIQIGFIPGVNGRSAPNTPGFVPPVPTIPNGLGTPAQRFPQSPAEGTFFSAEDILRASVYTTNTMDPRASVATTIYRNNAVVQPVAANVVRAGKANVVQVKNFGSATSTPHLGSAPPVPEIDPSHFGKGSVGAAPPSPAFSVGSTFLNKMNERIQETEGGSKRGKERKRVSIQKRPVPGRAVQAVAAVITESSVWEDSDNEEQAKPRPQTMTPQSSADETEFEDFSPFSDSHSLSNVPLPASAGLPPMANGGGFSRKAEKSGSTVAERRMSPFDDSNALDTDKSSI